MHCPPQHRRAGLSSDNVRKILALLCPLTMAVGSEAAWAVEQGGSFQPPSAGPGSIAQPVDPTSPAYLTGAGQTGPQPATTAAALPANGSNMVQEVVVTVNKRSENAREVPISIGVLNGAEVADHQITNYEDITRFVPGVAFTSHNGPGQDNLSIRGVSSTVGNPTVGVYIDEVPILTTNGYEGVAEPRLVDLDRIEVLRGPQGTLYGASSEGGTIRFLTNQPDATKFSAGVRSELSGTEHGGFNYDVQGSVNIPVIEDKLAVRVSGEYGRQSGYIDNYSLSGALKKKGVNSETDTALHVSMKFSPTADLVITPSVLFQEVDADDSPTFFPNLGTYNQNKQVQEFDRDQIIIPSLTVKKSLGFADLTSVSSYFFRHISRQADGTYFNSAAIAQYYLDPAYPQYQAQNDAVLANVASPVLFTDRFSTITQEFRLASAPTAKRIKWVIGVFYSDQKWTHLDHELAPGFGTDFKTIYGYDINSDPILGSPTNPGLWNNDLVWQVFDHNEVAQYAGFGQLDVDITPRLHASIGDRYVYARESFSESGAGFFDLGGAGTLGTPYAQAAGFSSQTPRASLTYDVTPKISTYATIAKGFRLGGATTPNTNASCVAGLAQLGLVNAPTTYGSDELYSYEAGGKSLLFGNTLSANGALYYIDWKRIQQTIIIPICGGAFNANVGDAEAYGGELELRYKPPAARGLTVGVNLGVEHATITSTTNAQTAAVGEDVLFVPQWTLSVLTDYERSLTSTIDGFLRADYEFVGRSKGNFQRSDPSFYNPSYGIANVNVGVARGSLELSLFIRNLTDNKTILQRPQINSVTEAHTLRPLTAGINLTKRF